ncbi:MAG: tRNA (adenosine(37)-N6)-dimethylallyltransferase MiaA [Flavobacteriaceae bacterium]
MTLKTLISIVGPTSIGKTNLAIRIAKQFNAEIISADSRQFYKEMSIGTAVPSKDELSMVKHHFIQHKSIFEPYSVGDFEREALKKLESLFKKDNIAVMVGGSGLYSDAVAHGLDDFPAIDPKIRVNLNTELKTKGISALQEKLKVLDPKYYNKVDVDNPHRLIRALEICIGTERPYSSFLNKPRANRPFKTITIGITANRTIIYERINQRVDKMMAEGLLTEARALYEYREVNALQTVGYKELFKYIAGEWELDFAISEIKKNTRRFAKRQLTWLNKNETLDWVDYQASENEIFDLISAQLKQDGNS